MATRAPHLSVLFLYCIYLEKVALFIAKLIVYFCWDIGYMMLVHAYQSGTEEIEKSIFGLVQIV